MVIEYTDPRGTIETVCFMDLSKAGDKLKSIIDMGGEVIQVVAVK